MPEFAVGQDHARQEGAKRRRQADKVHQKRDAHHDAQGQGGVHLAQLGGVDEAKDRGRQVDAGQDHRRHRAQGHQRDAPARQPLDQGQGMGGVGFHGRAVQGSVGVGLQPQGRQRQQRQEGQHRDHRDILRQKHRKGRSPARRLDQPLFRQGLQHDRGRGQRHDHPHGQRHLPGIAKRDKAGHHRQHGNHHLQPAQPQQPVPHVPQRAGFQLQPDQEQHHHHAEFGKMLKIVGLVSDQPKHRPDHDPGCQVAQHRPQPKPGGNRHRDDGGGKVDRGLVKETFHLYLDPFDQGVSVGSGPSCFSWSMTIWLCTRVTDGCGISTSWISRCSAPRSAQ